MKIAPVLLVAVLAGPLTGASPSAPSMALAKVDGETITGADVLAEFVKDHGARASFPADEREARSIVDATIDRRLLIREAYRLGLDRREDVRKAVDDFEQKKAVEYLLRTEIDEKAVPTEAEIRETWEKIPSVVYEMRMIELATPEDATAAYLDVLDGKSFEDVARACSIAPSRASGGKLPPVGWGSLAPSVEAAAFSLEPGDTAPPVKSPAGWAIVRMEAIRPVDRPEFDKARARIGGILRRRKAEARRAAFSEYLAAKYHPAPTALARSVSSIAEDLVTRPDAAVATWDGGALAVRDFVSRREIEDLRRLPSSRADARLGQLLDRAVNEALTRREAKERGIARLPEIADEVTHRRDDLTEGALSSEYIQKDLIVSDGEVRAELEKHPADWTSPERRRVAHILVKTREDAVAAKKRLDAGETFADVARKVSIDAQSRNTGGDLGWIVRKDVPPAFSAVLTFAPGQVSEPIASKFGWHLIEVTAIEPPRPMTFEEARDRVRSSLLERKKTEKRAEWVAKLRSAAKIEIDDARVRAFAKANAGSSGAAADPLNRKP